LTVTHGLFNYTAAIFHGHRDRMRIREKPRARVGLGKKSPDQAGQPAIGVAEQQPVP